MLKIFTKLLNTSLRWPVRTYAGPKLLQERVFLWRVWRRQNLHAVVTRQLDAHEAKRLRRERGDTNINTSYKSEMSTNKVTWCVCFRGIITYTGTIRDQECVSGCHASVCV